MIMLDCWTYGDLDSVQKRTNALQAASVYSNARQCSDDDPLARCVCV